MKEWHFLKLQNVILTPDALLRKAKQPGEESAFPPLGKQILHFVQDDKKNLKEAPFDNEDLF